MSSVAPAPTEASTAGPGAEQQPTDTASSQPTVSESKETATIASTETSPKSPTDPDAASTEPSTSTKASKDSTSPPTTPAAFASSVFSGFTNVANNTPKLNTSGFFSSMQGKFSSTLLSSAAAANAAANAAATAATTAAKSPTFNISTNSEQLANTTKDWGVSAFRSISTAAQRVSNNVTQGLQKEHDEFLKQKKLDSVKPHQGTQTLPAWEGLPDEDQFKARILSLSKDKRNFLLPPPPGTDFVFDMNAYSSTAIPTLRADPNLEKMRFYLVPREVEEAIFWRNYFYRVSLLKQVALSNIEGSPSSGPVTGFAAGHRGSQDGSENGEGGSSRHGSGIRAHGRTLSVNSALGYNIYFGKDDVDAPQLKTPRNTTKITSAKTVPATATAAAAAATAAVVASKKEEVKTETLFEADMPDHDEDPDAWLEKQFASGATIGGDDDDDDADVDVGDWEKELQNELKDYVETA
ncbi:hypothetical protein BGW38_000963 [Lunasporangiospora selenospora]|uniref:BSD domain-containing protein n=1 Tax=Lunasporangiospora selenospora TaxID=979761 RepID=A0A9P6FU39_9FUNG|nr:hypothetical protein BGW38_000963 [Lunasporangiospora selenospora]